MSLGRTLFSGGLWLLLQRFISTLSGFLGGIVLARALLPEDFGAVAMATALAALAGRFSSMGISQEIMRLDENKKDYHQWLSSFFWINLTILLVAFMLAYAAVLTFNFASTQTLEVIPFVMLGTLISNLFSPARTVIQKNMHFKKLSLIETVPNVLAILGAIYMALTGYGIWALVIPQMMAAITNGVLALSMSGIKLSLSLKKDALKRIRQNFFWFLSQSLTEEGYHKSDDLIIGAFFGNTILGLYRRAYNLGEYAHKFIGTIIQSIGYPLYTNQNHSEEQKKKFFSLSNKIILYGLGGVVLLLGAYIDHIIVFLYGEKWLEAAHYFIYLMPFAILLPQYQSHKKILIAYEQIRFVTKIDTAKLVIMISGAFALLSQLETQGVLIAVNISLIFGLLLTSIKLRNYKLLSARELIAPYSYIILQAMSVYLLQEHYIYAFFLISLCYLYIERKDLHKIVKIITRYQNA